MNFIKAHKMVFDGENGSICFKQPQPSHAACTTTTSTIIPARSEKFVELHVANDAFITRLTVFEADLDANKDLLLAKSVANVSANGTIRALVTNCTDKPIEIPSNKILGSVQIAEIITSVEDHPKAAHVNSAHADSTPRPSPQSSSQPQPSEPPDAIKFFKFNKDLADWQQELLRKLISKYRHVFSTSSFDIGRTGKIKHKIDVQSSVPLKSAPYRLPHTMRTEVNSMIRDLLLHDLIEPSDSPWYSPVDLMK